MAVVVLAIVVIFVSISKGWIGYMPPVEELENPNYKFATEIFSEDGKVLGTWSYSKENRVYTAYKDLSPNIINALIATEDVRFVEHSGIDAKALFRAFVKRGLMFQKNAGGGSTLSQQLAKQLFTENVARNTLQRLFQKPIEWVIAVKLERYYTKEEILSMYLNKFDFLNNAVGKGRNAVVLPRYQPPGFIKDGLHGKLVMLEQQILFGCPVVCIFRAEMFEYRQLLHLLSARLHT